jgi:hypothetical protein
MGISISSMGAGQVWLQSDGCFTADKEKERQSRKIKAVRNLK